VQDLPTSLSFLRLFAGLVFLGARASLPPQSGQCHVPSGTTVMAGTTQLKCRPTGREAPHINIIKERRKREW
jgi:hypothetical protein